VAVSIRTERAGTNGRRSRGATGNFILLALLALLVHQGPRSTGAVSLCAQTAGVAGALLVTLFYLLYSVYLLY
jgi:hypothetical protein